MSTHQMIASGLTIAVAVEAGDPPVLAGAPLLLIGCTLALTSIGRLSPTRGFRAVDHAVVGRG
jgi:hypothetical protein